MVKLKCSTCGYEYEGIHNLVQCPKCNGVGKAHPECTCVSPRLFRGVITGLMKYNPNCPVHKSGPSVDK